MALKVNVDERFELNENIPGQIEEAVSNGWKSFSILPNGLLNNYEAMPWGKMLWLLKNTSLQAMKYCHHLMFVKLTPSSFQPKEKSCRAE